MRSELSLALWYGMFYADSSQWKWKGTWILSSDFFTATSTSFVGF